MPHCKSCHTEDETMFEDLDDNYCVPCAETNKEEGERLALEDEFPNGVDPETE